MKNNTSSKSMLSYVLIFTVFLVFACITFYNGKKINEVTQILVEQKLPGIVAISDLKNNIQSQQIILHELYATADLTSFEIAYKHEMQTTTKLLSSVNMLPQYQSYETQIAGLLQAQDSNANKFVDVMSQPSVDWDEARITLAQFNLAVKATSNKLNILSEEAKVATLEQAELSQSLIEQLTTISLIIAAIILLSMFVLAWI